MGTQSRTLVVYYSRTGNTERVAKDVAARLGADLERIVDKASRLGFTGYLRAVYDSARKVAADIAARRGILPTMNLRSSELQFGIGT